MTPQELFDSALSYFEGKDGKERNMKKAHKLFLLAGQAGHVGAQAYLGRMYAMGEGVEQDFDEAIKWIVPAAEAGDPDAMNRLGVRYEKGQGVEEDMAKASEWFLKAAEAGFVKGMMNYARISYREDEETSIKWITAAAGKGDTNAMRLLGKKCHADKKHSDARMWFQKAADAGDIQSISILADLSVKGNPKKAFGLYRKAALKGSLKARRKYADLYNGTLNFDVDINEHLRLLYIWKDIPSLLSLAYFSMNGIGMKADAYEAVRLWKRIHNHGYKIANYNLAVAHYYGIGTDQDTAKAKEYLKGITECDRMAAKLLADIEAGRNEKPEFYLHSPDIMPDSILDAEMMMFADNHSKQLQTFMNEGTGEAFYRLARYYKHESANPDIGDINKSETLFEKAVRMGNPQAVYIKALYNDTGKSYDDYDLCAPYSLDEMIDHIYPDDDSYNIWDVAYVIWCILRKEGNESSDYMQIVSSKMSKGVAAEERRRELLRLCMLKDRAAVLEECREYMWNYLEQGREASVRFPTSAFIEEVNSHLEESESVCFYEGASLKFLKFLKPRIKYVYHALSQSYYAMAHLLADLMGIDNVTIKPKGTKIGKCDTLVMIPDLRSKANLESRLRMRTLSQKKNIKVLYDKAESDLPKRALILTNKDFTSSVGTEISTYRDWTLKEQHLNAVTEFPKGTFSDVETASSLLSMDFRKFYNTITFRKRGVEVQASYADVARKENVLSFDIYAHQPKEHEGMKTVLLSDIVDFRTSCDRKRKDETLRILSDEDFQSSLMDAIDRSGRFTLLKGDTPSPVHKEYRGPHIFMKYNDGVRLNIQTDDTYCHPGYDAYALKLTGNSPVTLEYLAYLLMSDETAGYLSEIVDSNGRFMVRDLMYMQIAIHTSDTMQKDIVEQALRKERQRHGKGLEYNVVVLSSDSNVLELIDSEAGFTRFAKDCTYEKVCEKYIQDTRNDLVDAIIVDEKSDDFADIMEDFSEIRSRNIHIYVVHGNESINIPGKKKHSYFMEGNRCFCIVRDEAKKRLIEKLRYDLDSSKVDQAKIRNMYKDVFEAADALDRKYPEIKISESILEYIQRGCRIYDVENISGPCGKFRNVCHQLLKKLAAKSLVPDFKNEGSIPAFIQDGKYYDKNTLKNYILLTPFMDQYLGRALDYFCKVTNEGVHGSQDSSRLGTAALNILMEFIVWFYENDIRDNRLDNIPSNFCWSIAYPEKLKDKIVEVKIHNDGQQNYIYADEIHFSDKDGVTDGTKVMIKKVTVKPISDNRRMEIDGKKIRYFVSDYKIV